MSKYITAQVIIRELNSRGWDKATQIEYLTDDECLSLYAQMLGIIPNEDIPDEEDQDLSQEYDTPEDFRKAVAEALAIIQTYPDTPKQPDPDEPIDWDDPTDTEPLEFDTP